MHTAGRLADGNRCTPAAAATPVAGLLGGAPSWLRAAVRTRAAVYFETTYAEVPVLCVARPDAVRMPYAVQVDELPRSQLLVGAGLLSDGARRWRVTRWWRPDRPANCAVGTTRAPSRWFEVPGLDAQAVRDLVVPRLVGAGPGLTPAGDDVLAAALVTAAALGNRLLDRLRPQAEAAMTGQRTTVVSRAMLHAALQGHCIEQLAAYLRTPSPETEARLLAVGHTSGRALRAGVWAVRGAVTRELAA